MIFYRTKLVCNFSFEKQNYEPYFNLKTLYYDGMLM
jgi:hypothetical protein